MYKEENLLRLHYSIIHRKKSGYLEFSVNIALFLLFQIVLNVLNVLNNRLIITDGILRNCVIEKYFI